MRTIKSKWPRMQEALDHMVQYPHASMSLVAEHYGGINKDTFRRCWQNHQRRLTDLKAQGLDTSPPPDTIKPLTHSGNPTTGAVKTSASFLSGGHGLRIAVIGDMQVKPGIDLSYCERIGRYMADKRPDVIVNIGDFADMPSLSFHDQPGSMGYEGQRYKADILAVHQGMKTMMQPIQQAMKAHNWHPRLVMTLGNHEDRIDRTIKAIPKLDGVMGMPDLEYERWGWEVHPFLKPVVIEGVSFCHYFCSGQMGRPISSARAILTKQHMSCIAGHQQGRDIAFGKRGDGKQIIAIICGSSYEHDENYLNHQTNNHWRGLYLLNNVVDGQFEELAVSLAYLRRKYGG